MKRLAAVLLLGLVSGCHSIAATGLTGPHPYAGMRMIRWSLHRDGSGPQVFFAALDFPLSLAVDTAMLPFTIFFIGNDPTTYGFTW